ncbi:MAG: diguanylate cyclase [Pirellulales bacterium]
MTLDNSKVLIVDDDPAIRRLLTKWLASEGYEVSEAADGRIAIAAIEASCPNFLVTDWEMPGGVSGLQLCQHVRRSRLPHYVYTVMLTGRSDTDDLVQALESGADDFTHKPVERLALLARLNAGSRIIELEHRLSELASRDPLTGLSTKRTLQEHFEREWRRACRYRTRLSCVMVDIDFFKRINDTHGHPAGDEVIRTIARVLTESCRATDFVGRVGGEEFCVVLPEADEESAVVWAERARAKVAETPIVVGGNTLGVTASFGVAQMTPDTSGVAQLTDFADQCLLAAKQAGRDRVLGHQELQRISAACRDPENAAGAVFTGVAARDVMTTIVAALPCDATIGVAAKYFLRFRFNSAPVVDEQGKLVGFVSEKDVMNVLLWPDCWTRKISDVMKTNVVCYNEDEPILTIYEFLCRVPIRSVVVAKDGKPTGIISRGALLRWFSNLVVARRATGNWSENEENEVASTARRQLALTAAAISRQVNEMRAALEGNAADDVTPQIVGGASRIQELVNDLLAGGQPSADTMEEGFFGAADGQPPHVDLPRTERSAVGAGVQ